MEELNGVKLDCFNKLLAITENLYLETLYVCSEMIMIFSITIQRCNL